MAAIVQFEWAICEGLILAVLIREWFSIQRELRRDREQGAVDARDDGTSDDDNDITPTPVLPSSTPHATNTKGQQGLHPGAGKALD